MDLGRCAASKGDAGQDDPSRGEVISISMPDAVPHGAIFGGSIAAYHCETLPSAQDVGCGQGDCHPER